MIEIRMPKCKMKAYVYNAGNEIEKGCRKNKITYSELANRIGVKENRIYYWATNRQALPLEKFDEIMRICGIEERDLNINDMRQSKEKTIIIRRNPTKKMDYVYNSGGCLKGKD